MLTARNAATAARQEAAVAKTRKPRPQSKGPRSILTHLPTGVKRGIDPAWQPEIDELSYSLGLYQVESYTDPGIMHGVDLVANTCTCLAWTRGRRPDCSHRKAARERRARKQALWQSLVALREEYGEDLLRETMEAVL